jgi:Tfp pilus assembly protein PilN
MRQQINLYQPVFSSKRKLFGAATVAGALAIVILGLVAFTTHSRMQLEKLGAEVEVLRTEQEERLAQAALSEEQSARGTPAEIESRIKALSRAIAARTHALQMLQSGAAGQATGFAPRLEALARRHVDGLWIDAIILSGANGSISLAGATVDADNVPRYLQNLAQDAVLTGTRFDDFLIERPAAEPKSEPVAVDSEGAISAPQKSPAPKHIRFRAGTRALYPDTPEAAT